MDDRTANTSLIQSQDSAQQQSKVGTELMEIQKREDMNGISSPVQIQYSGIGVEANGGNSTDPNHDDEAVLILMSLYELVRTDIVKCPECGDFFSYPCLLPCLHSVCGKCIDKLHQTADSKGECYQNVQNCIIEMAAQHVLNDTYTYSLRKLRLEV